MVNSKAKGTPPRSRGTMPGGSGQPLGSQAGKSPSAVVVGVARGSVVDFTQKLDGAPDGGGALSRVGAWDPLGCGRVVLFVNRCRRSALCGRAKDVSCAW